MVPKRSRMYIAEGRCPVHQDRGPLGRFSHLRVEGEEHETRNWIGVSDSHWSQLSQEGNSGSRVASHT